MKGWAKTMAIDFVINNHKKIQNMSVDDMAEYFSETLEVCCKPYADKRCSMCRSCVQCWKEFLLESD